MPHVTAPRTDRHTFIKSFHGVRYQVKDIARSVRFYTEQLGFVLRGSSGGAGHDGGL